MSHKTARYLSSLLRNCVSHPDISRAKQTHAQILLLNDYLEDDVTLQTDLLLSYCRCGSLLDARRVFDRMCQRNMHSWNILISSYAQTSLHLDAVRVFYEFRNMGFGPDHYTLPPLLKASAGLGDRYLGRVLHGWVIRLGFEGYVIVATSVLDFYLRCEDLVDAKRFFSSMMLKDSGVWSLMISRLGRSGLYGEALHLFGDMIGKEVKIDALIIPSVLNACGGEGELMKGREVHAQVVKNPLFNGDVAIGNSLIDMYAKSGCFCDSQKVFSNMCNLNVVTWTTMISCYGVHGQGEESLALFNKMKDHGFKPNPVTLTAVLASCSHSGLIDEGWKIFRSMHSDYGFEPYTEHYACMVDLLSRSGHLEEALGLAQSMKLAATESIWGALLAGCVMHKNVEIGEIAAHHLFKLEPRNSSNYIALCCIYESCSVRNGILTTRAKMRELNLAKSPACSWVIIAGIIYKFFQGDHSHLSAKVVSETLDGMIKIPMVLDDFECKL